MDFMRLPEQVIQRLCQAISESKTIINLTVSGSPNNKLTGRLFSQMATQTSIEVLDIMVENIGSKSFALLGEALAMNTRLHTLNLRKCSINNTDIENIVRGLAANPVKPMRSMIFHDIEFMSEGIKTLSAYLRYVNPSKFSALTFSFINNFGNGDVFAEMLKHNTGLKSLKFI